MCGINGLLTHAAPRDDATSLVAAMNNAVCHRGPDDQGVWQSECAAVVLGHRRLSILDLSTAGHQPMSLSTGETVVFNGEIYNYRELKARYSDHTYNSQSDTELLLAAYAQDGPACLRQLNGMFAFGIWDPKKETLFLGRDRIGKKPLYYTSQNGVFAFASEIKSLLTLPWVSAELDELALYDFLTFNFVPGERTMFKNIWKLLPGFQLTVRQDGSVSKSAYWEVEYHSLPDNQGVLESMLLESLERSVDYRLVSDVPVGAFLSGGVDSSALVALMSRQSLTPIKTFAIGFEGQPQYDELECAQSAANLFGTEHCERVVSRADIVDFLPRVVDIFDEPMADATCVPIFFLSQMAQAAGTKVIVNGDGPDELFLGYRGWSKYLRFYSGYRNYQRLPQFARACAANVATSLFPDSPGTEILNRAAKDQELFWGGARSFKEGTKRQFLSDDFLRRVGNRNCHTTIADLRCRFDQASPYVRANGDWMAYLGLKFLIPSFYMYRTDRLCMANSVEGRSPFLDYEFVNLALSISAAWKYRDGEPKFLLKQALRRILPHEILYRKKVGFCVPLREWAGDMMIAEIERTLPKFCRDTGIFREDQVRRQLRDVGQNGATTQVSTNLWTIYFLMAWFRKWIH